jgi:hypothetical protein
MKWLVLVVVLIGVALLATRNIGGPPAPDRPARAAITVECRAPAAFTAASQANARDLTGLRWAPFGAPEMGWDVYAPVVAAQINTDCAPQSAGFAAALSRWQTEAGLPATGRIDPETFEKMRVVWMLRRPFVQATRQGQCPAAPPEATLASATPEEGYRGKAVQLRPGALDAYRKLVAAARRDLPGLAQDKELLTLVSGYRNPQADAARCASDGNCGGPARANCSAHLTGLAMDLFVGAAPGAEPTSTSDENRSFQARTRLYAWLAKNAERFGFVGYPYEPWHWEWTGEPVTSG